MQTQGIKKIGGIMMTLILSVFIFLPTLILAVAPPPQGPAQIQDTGIVYDCQNAHANVAAQPGDCTFADLMAAVKNIINKGTILALAFSVVVIAYAGGKYMISGGNAGKRKEANEMLRKVVVGIVFVLAAWLIVTLITNALLTDAVKSKLPF